MFKRIVIAILSVVTAATLLMGCSFFSHDTERDLQQVVAEVGEYEIPVTVKGDDGVVKIKEPVYKTKPVNIYKSELNTYVYNNQSSLLQSFQNDPEGMFDYALELLVNTEIVINEVDAYIDAGLIEWGLTEKNDIKRRVYQVIDSTLISLKNDILEERDLPAIDTADDTNSVNTDTTYPIYEDNSEDAELKDTEEWEPSLSSYPGNTDDRDMRSLEYEAVRRFIALIKNNVEDDFRATEEDKKLFEEDFKRINEVIDKQGIGMVYPMIGSTHAVYYISGKSIERSAKITALQNYLTDSVTVSDEEVQAQYAATVNEQKSAYTNDVSAFDTAVTGGSTTVLYYPNSDYFYVKHILLPFSDEQTAALKAYKERLNVSEAQIDKFRDELVEGIVCYPHKDGEDDKSRPMTVDQVVADIRNKMLPLENNAQLADAMFDKLIYLYNTDPGAFTNKKGYAINYPQKEDDWSYMKEFELGARKAYDTRSVGQVLYEKVVTDYGVHIMYFASTTQKGEVGLDDYTTPAKTQTYYEVLSEPIKNARVSVAYTNWENNTVNYNFKQYATLYAERYENLWSA